MYIQSRKICSNSVGWCISVEQEHLYTPHPQCFLKQLIILHIYTDTYTHIYSRSRSKFDIDILLLEVTFVNIIILDRV
jgi:hypothetical protein